MHVTRRAFLIGAAAAPTLLSVAPAFAKGTYDDGASDPARWRDPTDQQVVIGPTGGSLAWSFFATPGTPPTLPRPSRGASAPTRSASGSRR